VWNVPEAKYSRHVALLAQPPAKTERSSKYAHWNVPEVRKKGRKKHYFLFKSFCPYVFDQFILGCYCPEGTIEKGDECVKPEECDATEPVAVPTLTTVCPAGKMYRECGNPCPPSCDNPDPFCSTVCTSPGKDSILLYNFHSINLVFVAAIAFYSIV